LNPKFETVVVALPFMKIVLGAPTSPEFWPCAGALHQYWRFQGVKLLNPALNDVTPLMLLLML